MTSKAAHAIELLHASTPEPAISRAFIDVIKSPHRSQGEEPVVLVKHVVRGMVTGVVTGVVRGVVRGVVTRVVTRVVRGVVGWDGVRVTKCGAQSLPTMEVCVCACARVIVCVCVCVCACVRAHVSY